MNKTIFKNFFSGQNIFLLTFLSVVITLGMINMGGCKKKTEPVIEEKPTEIVKEETTAVETPDIFSDIKGVWKGKFDLRDFTLTITSQEGNSFTGKTVINYREQIRQDVSGTINMETSEVTIKDLLHSRYAGTYKGKISEDRKTISGKFTVTVDGNKFDFNLTHQ